MNIMVFLKLTGRLRNQVYKYGKQLRQVIRGKSKSRHEKDMVRTLLLPVQSPAWCGHTSRMPSILQTLGRNENSSHFQSLVLYKINLYIILFIHRNENITHQYPPQHLFAYFKIDWWLSLLFKLKRLIFFLQFDFQIIQWVHICFLAIFFIEI